MGHQSTIWGRWVPGGLHSSVPQWVSEPEAGWINWPECHVDEQVIQALRERFGEEAVKEKDENGHYEFIQPIGGSAVEEGAGKNLTPDKKAREETKRHQGYRLKTDIEMDPKWETVAKRAR